MATLELRAMTVGEILDNALTVYRRNFGTLVGCVTAAVGVPMLLTIYVELTGGVLERPLLYLLAVLLYWIGNMLAAGAVIWIVSELFMGREPTIGEALAFGRGCMWKLFGAGLAKYLLIVLGMMLFFVPGIIIACGYAVVNQVAALESGSSTGALRRSWDLTAGYKGKAFQLGLVTFVMIYVPMFALGLVAGFAPRMAPAITALTQLIGVVLLPILACVFTLFYYDLRVRKEGFDVEVLSQQLAAPAAG